MNSAPDPSGDECHLAANAPILLAIAWPEGESSPGGIQLCGSAEKQLTLGAAHLYGALLRFRASLLDISQAEGPGVQPGTPIGGGENPRGSKQPIWRHRIRPAQWTTLLLRAS